MRINTGEKLSAEEAFECALIVSRYIAEPTPEAKNEALGAFLRLSASHDNYARTSDPNYGKI